MYRDSLTNLSTHFKVLRVDSSGAYSMIDVYDWTDLNYFSFPFDHSEISNAGDGILLSWWWNGGDEPVAHLTKVSSAGVSDANGPIIPGQEQAPVSLGLQREDGSFLGTAMIGDKSATLDNLTPYMVAFDATGNVLWSVANEQPQIATDDDGVIGKSGIAYDTNGNAVGRIDALTQSWRGYTYQIGSVDRVAAAIISYAENLWPRVGGNPSGNNTAPATSPALSASVVLPSLPSVTEGKSYMPTVLAEAQRVVNQIPACAAIFGTATSRAGAFDPATVLNALYTNIGTLFMKASLVGGKPVSSSFVWGWFLNNNEGAEAITFYVGIAGVATGPHVYLNLTDWNMEGEMLGVSQANSLTVMSTLLLHEMGHVYNELVPQGSGGSQIVQNDAGNPLISDGNDQLIFRNCFPQQ